MRNVVFPILLVCLSLMLSPARALTENPSSAPGGAAQALLDAEGLGEIIAVGPSWKSFTNMDGTGLYHEILNEVFGLYGLKVVRKYMPSERARLLVRNGVADVMTCYAEETIEEPSVLSRVPMYENAYYVFFSRDKFPDWQGLKSLDGRTVAWRIGYYNEKSLDAKIIPKEVASGTAALGMVLLGRADYYLDDMNLIKESLEATDVPFNMDDYRIERVGSRKYFPVFNDSPRGEKIQAIYEQGMERLFRSGALREIYEKWGHPAPEFPFGEEK